MNEPNLYPPQLNEKKTVQLSWLDIIIYPIVFIFTYILIKGFLSEFPFDMTFAYFGFFTAATVYIMSKRKCFHREAILPGVLAILTALSFTLHGTEYHFIVTFPMLIYLSGSYCVKLTRDTRLSGGSYFYLLDIFRYEVLLPVKNLFLPLRSLSTLKKHQGAEKKRPSGKIIGLIGGIILAVPALLIILPLLIESDAAFEGLAGSVLNTVQIFINKIVGNISRDFDDSIFILIPTFFVSPYIYSVMFCFRHSVEDEKAEKKNEKYSRLRFVPINIFVGFLGIICLVYLIYLLSQTAYFFSAFTGKLPGGMEISVTEYARRGFFEMAKIAVINFVLIAVTVLLSKRINSKLHKAIKWIDVFLCVFTIILVATSISKILLYIAEMGLTHKRIYVFVIDIILIVCFGAIIARLFKENFPYMKVILSFACCMITLLSLVGTDGLIAKYNAEMYLNGKHQTVDIDSMHNLGLPALKSLDKLTECENKNVSTKAKSAVAAIFYADVMNFQKPDGEQSAEEVLKNRPFTTVDNYSALKYAKKNFERLAQIHGQYGWWYTENAEMTNKVFASVFNNTAELAAESLSINIESYETVVKYLISTVEDKADEKYVLGVDIENDSIVLWEAADDGRVLEISKEVTDALMNIKQAFNEMGYLFDAIRIQNGEICFDTIDGCYALIYVLNEDADTRISDESDYIIDSTHDNWYHKISA